MKGLVGCQSQSTAMVLPRSCRQQLLEPCHCPDHREPPLYWEQGTVPCSESAGSGGWWGNGSSFFCQPLMKFAVNININLFLYILSGLDSSKEGGRRTSCATGKFPRFNGANAWLSQSFIAACRHRSHFFRRFQDVSWHATVPCAGLMAVTIAWEVPGFLVSRLFQGTACAALSRLLSVPVSVLTGPENLF